MILKLKWSALRRISGWEFTGSNPRELSCPSGEGNQGDTKYSRNIKWCSNISKSQSNDVQTSKKCNNAQATTALFFVFIRVAGVLYFFRREQLFFSSLWQNPRIVKTNNEYRKLKCSEFIAYEMNSESVCLLSVFGLRCRITTRKRLYSILVLFSFL